MACGPTPIGVGRPIGGRAGHREGLWVVGQPAPPPNGVGGELIGGGAGWGKGCRGLGQLPHPPSGWERPIRGRAGWGEWLQEVGCWGGRG